MSSSAHEDLESKDTGMEDSDSRMTIEFLRARLLSERSVSKSAKQRVEDLTKRVAELEGHLKYVSFQRKKAEKATADVLAILENSGVTDVSEEFDSCSDEDNGLHEFEARMIKEASKIKRDDMGSSGVDSPQSTTRSLSWKSTKNAQFSTEKKKYFDSVSRRSSVASNSSSGRRAGKSCRRVRRRDIRQQEDLQNDGLEKVTCPTDASNCSDGNELRETGGCENDREGPTISSKGEVHKVAKSQYIMGRERDGDMENALRHRAQLIGQYEEEEKAQREWEEKFRENGNAQQDSHDPGIHSDMTEERYDNKSHELLSAAETLSSNNQETNQEQIISVPSNEEFQTPNADKVTVQQETIAHEDSTPGFSFPVPDDNNMPSKSLSDLGAVLESLKQAKLSLNQTMVSKSVVMNSDSQTNNMVRFGLPMASPGLFTLPTDQQNGGPYGFDNSTSEIARSRFVREQSINSRRGFLPELTPPGADYPGVNMQSCFANYSPEMASGRFLVDSRGSFSSDLTTAYPGVQSRFVNFSPKIASTRFPLDQVVDSRNRYDHNGIGYGSTFPNYSPEITGTRFRSESPLDGRFLMEPTQSDTSTMRSAVYPQGYISQTTLSSPDAIVRLGFGEGTSRNFETGLPPTIRLPSYDDVIRRP